MKKITWVGVATFSLAGLTYFIPQWNVLLAAHDSWWPLAKEFILFSGVTAWMFMTLAMILSLRLPVIEAATGGLDKGFVLHKWSGIIALVAGVMHWLMEIVPKWMAQQGWVTRPAKPRRIDAGAADWPLELASTGQSIAEWAIYVLIILCVVSLVKKIPYSFFRFVHKIFPLVYLSVTFHAITVLAKTTWWLTVSSWIIVILAAIGSIAAFMSLFQRIGKSRKRSATVARIEHNEDMIDVILQTEKPMHFRSGQFAFVRFGNDKEPHPFTIASSPDNPCMLRFVIKALGDDTWRLFTDLRQGDTAEVEGPYGCFDFTSSAKRQIWVAGGIGITPFLSRLTVLAQKGGSVTPIDFWYCGRKGIPEGLKEICHKANVLLHVIDTSRQKRLDKRMLSEAISSGEKVGIWFCGPASFGHSLQRGLKDKSIEFHCDSFSLR
ncbi:putative oxidoreductase [Trabulsiella guamensis ATCC 49490]|uniref:Putative oxidoreductase n=1 Tax=Trabulsiella guamensis ATCC 49490 TaxID=1005994 RepID=A0A085AGY2_9ENTR|nr:ferric reductase-like transmembrane domain-containing protein [Trabulsiella guamensis]KFC09477.1 putative oxidoreductase [Trabulsiella guamensis ATCC 49490]